MGNMSYCRFENTAKDLEDCRDHWDDKADEELSSDYERRGKQRLRKLIVDMASWLEDS